MIESQRIGNELDRSERRAEEYLPRHTHDDAHGHPPEQHYHEDTVLMQQREDAAERVIADAAIGDVQYWLKRFGKGRPLIVKEFKRAFKILARRRAQLKKGKAEAKRGH